MNRPEFKHLRFIVLAITGGLVLAYCSRHTADLHIILHLNAYSILALIVLITCANTIGAVTVFRMLRWLGLNDLGFLKWLRISVTSRFANFYVAQGANVYRALKLKREYSFSYSESLGLTGAITCFNVVSILLVTAVLLLVSGLHIWIGFAMLGAAALSVAALAAVPCLTRRMVRHKSSLTNCWLVWSVERLAAMSSVLARCTQDGTTIGLIAGMTVLVYLAFFLGVYVCLTAFGHDVSMFSAALLTSAFVLSRTINIVPGNLGVSELITGLSAGALAGGAVYGVMIAVIFRVIDFAVIGTALLAFSLTDIGKKVAEDSR